MRYPVTLTPDKKDGGYVVTFKDIPEAVTQGETVEEAMRHASDALESALEFYFEEQRPVPMPSQPSRNQQFIELPASLSAKILVLNEMVKQRVRPVELARRMKTTPQEVNRLTNLRHPTKIDRLGDALKVLGKTLVISTQPSAGEPAASHVAALKRQSKPSRIRSSSRGAA
jgi:antitoxin HicB